MLKKEISPAAFMKVVREEPATQIIQVNFSSCIRNKIEITVKKGEFGVDCLEKFPTGE